MTLFATALRARRLLYQTGIFRKRRLSHPVISVGNLTVGGTGKTPVVMTLARGLTGRGFRPVILSRGYRRRGSGVTVVSRGDLTAAIPWERAGDEPYLMAQRLPDTAVVVGASRYRAGRKAERLGLGNIFILDDGFQHWKLHRDFDIVTVDPEQWMEPDTLLPYGIWREPREAVQRADAACVRMDVRGISPPDLGIPSFWMTTRVEGLWGVDGPIEPADLRGKEIVAIAGIARPERFFELLGLLGLQPARQYVFRDHHRFSETDLQTINGEVVVTTEKDAVRLPPSWTHCVRLRISANIPELEELLDLIQRRIQPQP